MLGGSHHEPTALDKGRSTYGSEYYVRLQDTSPVLH
jgi:hypothetical protein